MPSFQVEAEFCLPHAAQSAKCSCFYRPFCFIPTPWCSLCVTSKDSVGFRSVFASNVELAVFHWKTHSNSISQNTQMLNNHLQHDQICTQDVNTSPEEAPLFLIEAVLALTLNTNMIFTCTQVRNVTKCSHIFLIEWLMSMLIFFVPFLKYFIVFLIYVKIWTRSRS